MRAFLALTAAAAFVLPTSVAAQESDDLSRLSSDIQTGTRFKLAPETPDAGKSREMQKEIARCATFRNKKLVREILAKSDPSQIAFGELSVDSSKLGEKLKINHCMTRAMSQSTVRLQMRFNYQAFRNIFAEEVYLMDVKKPREIAPGELEKVENRYFVGGSANPMADVMAGMGDCFSYRAAAEGDAFLRTRPGTSGEREAVEAFMPVAAPCMGDNTEIDVDVSMMRKIVADGLWSRHHYRLMAQAEEAAE
jgi:hypothetical protein